MGGGRTDGGGGCSYKLPRDSSWPDRHVRSAASGGRKEEGREESPGKMLARNSRFQQCCPPPPPPLCPPTHICNYLRFVHLVLCVQPPPPPRRRRLLLPRGLVFIPEFIYITTRNAAPDEIKHFSANSQKGPSSCVDGPFVLPACWWWWIQFPRS